jgi:hypothetical protein
MTVATAAASAQQPSYMSVEKVRAALLKPPPKLNVEYRQPDFKIRIQERRPLDDLFDVPLWDTPAVVRQPASTLAHIEGTPGNTPALIQTTVDPGSLAQSAAKTARARIARTQTERAIAEYCAAQPDAGLSVPLCWASSPGR